MRTPVSTSALALFLAISAGWGCGGDDLVLPEQPPSVLEITGGNNQKGAPGAPLPQRLIVRLSDQDGTGIPDRAVVWAVGSGGGNITPSSDKTDAEGFSAAVWTLGPEVGVQRASAQVPGVGTVTFTATNIEGGGGEPVPSRVEEVEGSGQEAEAGTAVATSPAVRVLDEDSQPVEGYEVTFVVTAGGGSVSGATQTTDAEGIARVGGWTLGEAPGTNALEARAGSLAGSPVVFTAIGTEREPEPEPHVDRLVYRTPPHDAVANESFRVEVALVDVEGDVVPLSGIFIYLGLFREGSDTPVNDLLSGERFENTEDGIAVFNIAVEQPGHYRLRALTDDLPEYGQGGPRPYLYSEVFEVE